MNLFVRIQETNTTLFLHKIRHHFIAFFNYYDARQLSRHCKIHERTDARKDDIWQPNG